MNKGALKCKEIFDTLEISMEMQGHVKYLKSFVPIFSKHSTVKMLTIFEYLKEMKVSIFSWEIFSFRLIITSVSTLLTE